MRWLVNVLTADFRISKSKRSRHSLGAIKAEIGRDRRANASQKAELVRNGLAIESQQRKHLDLETAVRVNTLAIERGSTLDGPKAAKIARKIWLIESTGRDNVRAYQTMCAEMTVMNNALDKLTMKR